MFRPNPTNIRLTLCLLLICYCISVNAQQAAAPVSGSEHRPAAAPAEQANEIVCSSSTACKTGFVPLFASNGGSAKVQGSALFQSGKKIGINNTAPVPREC